MKSVEPGASLKELNDVLKVLKDNGVCHFKNAYIDVTFAPKDPEPQIGDKDDRQEHGHRLRPPTDKEIKEERLEVW